MSYILIPQIVTENSAMIWVGAIDTSVRTVSVYLEYKENNQNVKPSTLELAPSEWRTWKTRHPLEKTDEDSTVKSLHYQRVTIKLEKPHTKYTVKLLVGKPDAVAENMSTGNFQDYSKIIDREVFAPVEMTEHLTKATVTTLPKSIPVKPETPFKIMLGSCFYQPNDPDGLVGQSFLHLPEQSRPDIKFLCGDQVYLDNPWMDTTLNLKTAFSKKENMRAFFFKKYLKTWTQVNKVETDETDENGKPKTKVIGGFNLLLRNGANYFCSDDHEFWNNAPNFGGVGFALTFFLWQKRWWFREASELFRVFQSLAAWMTFDVAPVSFCIADTRINRTEHNLIKEDLDANFMEPDDLKAIGKWIENLKGPGVLVMGQLLLTDNADWKKTFRNLSDAPLWTRIKESFGDYFDFGLPDFPSQYNELIGYIKKSKHSIVLLTGDVHFGRLAVCKVDANSDVDFIEVISSPMSVVTIDEKRTGIGTYEDAPERFGTKVTSVPIAQNDDEKPVSQNHFTTLEFSRNSANDSEVEMKIIAWKIVDQVGDKNNPNKPSPTDVQTIVLK